MFLGAIGDPRVTPGILEKGILLKMRFELDQYINLRPIRLYPGVETPLKNKGPADIDYCVVRENSGGLYTGMGGISRADSKDAVATQVMTYTYEQVERCIRSISSADGAIALRLITFSSQVLRPKKSFSMRPSMLPLRIKFFTMRSSRE